LVRSTRRLSARENELLFSFAERTTGADLRHRLLALNLAYAQFCRAVKRQITEEASLTARGRISHWMICRSSIR